MRRTRRTAPDRFLFGKVGLFFLGAGVWLAGLISGRMWLTGAAIVILLVAIVLRLVSDREDRLAMEEDPEEEEGSAI